MLGGDTKRGTHYGIKLVKIKFKNLQLVEQSFI